MSAQVPPAAITPVTTQIAITPNMGNPTIVVIVRAIPNPVNPTIPLKSAAIPWLEDIFTVV